MNYDLEDRTKNLAVDIIQLLRTVKTTDLNKNIVAQLLKSGTSVGANYREANGAVSRSDFRNKIYICKKEIKETCFWLEMLAEASPEAKIKLRPIWSRAHELTLIFNKISLSLNKEKDVA